MRGAITSYIDVAQLVLYAFWLFFAGLIFYLRGEDRREGYPLESEVVGGRPQTRDFLLIPTPKIFNREDGQKVEAPDLARADTRPLSAGKVEPWPGAPIEPIGNPLLAGVGPGSWAERTDAPEKAHDGGNMLAPLRLATNFTVAAEDVSPLGFEVVGADGEVAGVVRDLWVDRSEIFLRYYEVGVGGRSVMLPYTFAKVDFSRKQINVQAILGEQFAGVPATRDPDSISLLEEDKIMAYYGAGTLYATTERSDPLL